MVLYSGQGKELVVSRFLLVSAKDPIFRNLVPGSRFFVGLTGAPGLLLPGGLGEAGIRISTDFYGNRARRRHRKRWLAYEKP
jgi:hypothetical protein